MRGHTLLEPVIVAAVGVGVFCVGRAIDSVAVCVVGGGVVGVGVVVGAVVARAIDRQRKAWASAPTSSAEPPS